jgi:hypothetical protein
MVGLYVQLDTNWPDHPKVIAAGLEGAGLHAMALCLAKRLLTDGVLYRAQLCRLGATPELIDRLVDVGLLEPIDEYRVAVHDWLDRNPSREAIRGNTRGSSLEGRRGNHKRWKHPGPFDTCPRCNPRSVVTPSRPTSAPDRPPILEGGTTRETQNITNARVAANAASPLTAEGERQQLIDQAATILAERRAAIAGGKGPGWVHSAARGIAKDRHQEAHAILLNLPAEVPNLTPTELADRLAPPPAASHEVDTAAREEAALAGTAAAFNVRAAENQRRLRDMLDEAPTDPDAQSAHVAEARDALHPR